MLTTEIELFFKPNDKPVINEDYIKKFCDFIGAEFYQYIPDGNSSWYFTSAKHKAILFLPFAVEELFTMYNTPRIEALLNTRIKFVSSLLDI